MAKTKIEWATDVWNPITGCSAISEGCKNCYARRMARRLAGRYGYPKAPNHFDVTFHIDKLEQPYRWKKPRKIFICSMGDLFHENVPYDWLWRVLDSAYDGESYHRHMFLFLTKRPDIMADKMDNWMRPKGLFRLPKRWWLGITAENQKRWDERCFFLDIPASKHFVSFEPLLGAVEIESYPCPQCNSLLNPQIAWPCPYCNGRRFKWPDWVIAGPETGPGKRECKPEWIESLYDQCYEAGIPFFDKTKNNWLAREFPMAGKGVSE